jgi:hypothetical protein
MPPKKKVGFASDVTSTKVAATTATKAAAAAKASTTAGKKKAAAPSRPGIVKAAEVAPVPAAAKQQQKKATPAAPKKKTTTAKTNGKKAPAKAKSAKGGKKGKKGGKLATGAYQALQLRHLPAVFQEPELRKFLSQFGTDVEGCYVVRTTSNASRGTAYVTFSPKTSENQYDAILDECHGMLLGGNTVTAKYVTLNREMPSRKVVDARRKLDWLNKTRGRKLSQHDVTQAKSAFETLKSAAATERRTNAFLAKLGIAYEFHGFQEQLESLPADFVEAQIALKVAAREDGSDSDAGDDNNKKKASPKRGKAVEAAAIEALAQSAVRVSTGKAQKGPESTPVRAAAASPEKKASARKSTQQVAETSSPLGRKSTGATSAATPAVRTVRLTAEATPKSPSRRVDAPPASVKATPAAAKSTPTAAKVTPKPASSATKKGPAWR